jgi:hypothetical protein
MTLAGDSAITLLRTPSAAHASLRYAFNCAITSLERSTLMDSVSASSAAASHRSTGALSQLIGEALITALFACHSFVSHSGPRSRYE